MPKGRREVHTDPENPPETSNVAFVFGAVLGAA